MYELVKEPNLLAKIFVILTKSFNYNVLYYFFPSIFFLLFIAFFSSIIHLLILYFMIIHYNLHMEIDSFNTQYI